MTKQLAHANITSVMNDERRKQTEQKLIRSGRAEFLEKGYAKANLRDICKAVGVTTGAFYFSFENKEALLAAILEPVIADYQRMCSVFAKREEDDPGTADDNERQMMEYLSAHRTEAIILMEKSAGSRYEGFKSQIDMQMQSAFTSYFSKFMGCQPRCGTYQDSGFHEASGIHGTDQRRLYRGRKNKACKRDRHPRGCRDNGVN